MEMSRFSMADSLIRWLEEMKEYWCCGNATADRTSK